MLPIKVNLSTFAVQDGTPENIMLSIYPDLAVREKTRTPTNIWLGIICDTSGSMADVLHFDQTPMHDYIMSSSSPNGSLYDPMYLGRTSSSLYSNSMQADDFVDEIVECDLGNGFKYNVSKDVSLSKQGIASRAIAKALICLAFDTFVQTLALDIVFYSDVCLGQITSNNIKDDLHAVIDKIMAVRTSSGGTDITTALPIMLAKIEQRKHATEQSYILCVTDGYDFGNKTVVESQVKALHDTGVLVLPTMCIGAPNVDFDTQFASYLSTGKYDVSSYVCAQSATEIADKMMHIILGGANLNTVVTFTSTEPIISYYINGKHEPIIPSSKLEQKLNILSHMFIVLSKTATFKITANDQEYAISETDDTVGIRFAKVLKIRKQIETYDVAKCKYIVHAQNLLCNVETETSSQYIRQLRQLFFDAVRTAYAIYQVQDSDITLPANCSQSLQLATYLLRVEEERRIYVHNSLKSNFIEGLVVVSDDIYNSPNSDSMSGALYVLSSRSPSSGIPPPPPSASLSVTSKPQVFGSASCAVCMTNKKNVMFVPCKHVCVCLECYQVMSQQHNACPLCRQEITNIVAVKGTNSGACLSCNKNEAKCCLLPCSHLAVCEQCVNESVVSSVDHKCPLCHAKVALFFNAFV